MLIENLERLAPQLCCERVEKLYSVYWQVQDPVRHTKLS